MGNYISKKTDMKPQFLSYTEKQTLTSKQPYISVHDHILFAIEELYDIAHPDKKDSKNQSEVIQFGLERTSGKPDEWGSWVFYPWLHLIVHIPPKDDLYALRTSRNRNLVSADEQQTLRNSTVLIAGMSVGSNVVEALISQGIAGKLILADMDIIEPSNLNRIRSPYHHVGLHKVDAISRKVWEIDPYIEIIGLTDGLHENNLQKVLENHDVDILIDEMDELRMKIKLRETAKRKKLPVLMAADDGDDALMDIERYDIEPELPIFHGLIPQDILDEVEAGSYPRAKLGMVIGKYFIGTEHIPLRMYQSLTEVGKSLPSWPQLGSAAALSGLCVAFAAKKVLLNQPLKSGRTLVSMSNNLGQTLNQEEEAQLQQYQNMLNNAV
jgi:hypothetical protein